MPKYASIDIGSNTLLLLVVDDADGELRAIVDECDFGRLSQGLSESDSLHPDAIARSLAIVERYRVLMNEHDIALTKCVGTQALRESKNRNAFIEPAQKILGATIEVIAGEREAELVAMAVRNCFPKLCSKQVVTVDVGGASTEFIVIENGVVKSVKSLPIGAVRLSEEFLGEGPTKPEQVQALFAAIDSALSALDLPPGAPIVGSAGTATSIASIAKKLPSYQPDEIHGLELGPNEVQEIALSLLEMPLAEKKLLIGLEPQRADVIAGGVAIYSRVLELMASPRFVVSDRGVRWGLVYEAMAQSVTS